MYFFILFGACVLLFLSYHGLVSLYKDFKKNYPVHAWFLSNPRLFISLVTTNSAKKSEKDPKDQKQINAGSFQIDEDSCFEYKSIKVVPYAFKEKPYVFLRSKDESETNVAEALQQYLEEKNGLVYSIDHIQEMDISKVFGPYGTPPPDDLFFDYMDYLKISGRITVKRIGNDDLVYDTVMREQINE